MKRLVIDLDGTITIDEPGKGYHEKTPNADVVMRLREYREAGFEIVIQTARNMRTHSNSVGKITAHTVPVILDWLKFHDIPYDELHVGKPWCGTEGFYVDDRAIRPDEFVSMSREQIAVLLGEGDPQ
ncbi:capsular biosynthesis protein [Novosphingobium sediminicola]|uniref:Capsule biosynthesis phosphatase n=1 Tax=Novosphingobium sediminicola TaxID=563162 RepID=A0A7W6CJD3_9SPHN|nr:capsular biosynthesis protein [Novosphingobium sediminicola]MBB3957631.1 capsule biosynthesis phosphatase [Novosphingobium sediminicola]